MATREQLIEDFADHKLATGEKFVELINSMKTVQEPVADPAASGTSLSFIDSIEQNADGKIMATKKTLDLANAHELNPFKGWYKTGDTLPTDGFDGAYLYFKDTSELTGQTTIYRWNGTAYADTGTVVDTSNVNTFETGQAVNAVKIMNEAGVEDAGAEGVLSAEAGMKLSEKIFNTEKEDVDIPTLQRTGYIKQDGTFANITSVKCLVVPTAGHNKFEIQTASGSGATYAFLTSNELVEGQTPSYCNGYNGRIAVTNGTTGSIAVVRDIPDSCTYLYVYMSSPVEGAVPTAVQLIRIENNIERLSEEITAINNKVNVIETQLIYDESVNVPLTPIIHGFIDSSNLVKNHSQIGYILVPTEGYDKAAITSNANGGVTYAFLTSNELVYNETPYFCSGYEGRIAVPNTTGSPMTTTVDIPTDCVYLYVYMSSPVEGKTPTAVQLIKSETIKEKIDGLGVSIANILPLISRRIVFVQGRYDGEDWIKENNVVTSGVIAGGRGFSLVLREGYKVRAVHMTDLAGNVVFFNMYPPDVTSYAIDAVDRRIFASENFLPQFGCIVEVVRTDGASINYTDAFVETFEYLDKTELVRDTNANGYEVAHYRMKQITNLFFTPIGNIPLAISTSNPSQEGYYYKKGNPMNGLPYSDVAVYEKYVGQHVSFYTFLTAVHNPLSLLYTEQLASDISHYGISYANNSDYYANPYFGTVCSGFTGYIMGRPMITIAANYENISSMTEVSSPDFDNVEVLDLIWTPGHISLVSDIISENGVRKYVVWAEQSRPTSFITPYTEEFFNKRLSDAGGKVYRWNGWSGVQMPTLTPFISQGVEDYEEPIDYNEDICTFAGDKATFGVGDVIYLNVRRHETYTSVKLYTDEGNLVETISIDSLPTDTFLQDNTDDWVSVNLTTYNLPSGKYKACAVDGSNNTSDFTYFEILDVQLSVSGSGNSATATFSSSNGLCYLVQAEAATGFPSISTYPISGNGSVVVTLDSSHRYIKVFVSGDYGVAVKRIYVPTA